jgi:ferredoxin like protein
VVSDEILHSGNKGLADSLSLVKYRTDPSGSHLRVRDLEVCRRCERKPCIPRCCSEVYRWRSADATLEVAYENCLECGVCKIVCPYENIQWSYPRGGYGVVYKHG